MAESKKRECANCRYWQRAPMQVNNGVCKRNPPVALVMPSHGGVGVASTFPMTASSEWCGEHAPVVIAEVFSRD